MAKKTFNQDKNKGENIHDKLFKQTFSRVEAMRDYITHFLPNPDNYRDGGWHPTG